ncbi:MAG: restriction endonuclease subunit S, partial [Ruminococcus sp.]|nr:restriction endonuclease subunit S [Ruminococcus sp.]
MSKWKTVRLGEICSLNMGQSPKSDTYNNNGMGIPFFQGNADFGAINPNINHWCSEPVKIANVDDILISVRAPVGALNIANFKCCIGRGLASITVDKSIAERNFIWYMLKSKIDELQSKSNGSTFKAINKTTLYDVTFPLPPLEIQKQIASSLDKVTHIIDLCNAIIEKMDFLVKAKFVEMFGGINNSNLYPYHSVDTFTNVTSGGTPERKNNDYWDNGLIPWIKTTELHNNVICEAEESITEKGLNESSAKLVPKGTILIAMYGQGKTRGMTALLDIESSTNQACACILPCDKLNTIYLWQYFVLSYDKLRDLAKGGNQPNL